MIRRTVRHIGSLVEILESRSLLAAISFGPPVTSPLGAASTFAAADVNGDDFPDLIVKIASSATVSSIRVHLGLGDGKFSMQSIANLNAGPTVTSIVAADFDGDGNLDVACATGTSAASIAPNVRVFLGAGDGTFAPPTSAFIGADPRALSVGDLNEDGNPDLVSANFGAWSPPFTEQPSTYGAGVLLGNGDGTFQTVRKIYMIDPQTGVALGDFNGDENLDAAFAGPFLQSAAPFPVSALFAALGDGTGLFDSALTVGTVMGEIDGVAAGNISPDQRADVALVRSFPRSSDQPGDATVHLFFGRSPTAASVSPLVAAATQIPLALTHAAGISLADFNRDSRADVAVSGQDARPLASPVIQGALAVISGPGATASAVPQVSYFLAGPVPFAQAIADLNHDGEPDVVMTNSLGATSLLNMVHPVPAANDLVCSKDELVSMLD